MDFTSLNVRSITSFRWEFLLFLVFTNFFSFPFFFLFYRWDFSCNFQGTSVAHPMNSPVIMRGAFLPVSVVMARTTVAMEATRGVVVSSVFHLSSFSDAQSIHTFFFVSSTEAVSACVFWLFARIIALIMQIFSSPVLSTWLFCSNLSFSNYNSPHHEDFNNAVTSVIPVSRSHSSAD